MDNITLTANYFKTVYILFLLRNKYRRPKDGNRVEIPKSLWTLTYFIFFHHHFIINIEYRRPKDGNRVEMRKSLWTITYFIFFHHHFIIESFIPYDIDQRF